MIIVIASDSFKGSVSSSEAASYIAEGILSVFPNATIASVPVADGGEGTAEALIDAFAGSWKQVEVSDPLGRTIIAKYGLFEPKSAVMEMASASGLTLLKQGERNPFYTSSRGTGEMILDALSNGVDTFYIGIGGSATNDGGLGMVQALGVKALDDYGRDIEPGIKGLMELRRLDVDGLDLRLKETNFHVFCDVSNPLTGIEGATFVYGPQKGLKEEDLVSVDQAMNAYGKMLNDLVGWNVAQFPGAGAAGGLGAAFAAFLDAKLVSGVESVLELLSFDTILKNADLVITGEGFLDTSSLSGKTPIGVATYAKKYGIPVIAIVGGRSENVDSVYDLGIDLVIPTVICPMSLERAMKDSPIFLREAGKTAIRAFMLNRLTL